MATVWLILGLILLVAGAELVVRGGSRAAGYLGISPIIVGLTVVSLGTSAPELAVGIEAARRGAGSLAIGNIAGTNVVNILLILGSSALLRPLAMRARTLRFDLPLLVVSALALVLMALDGILTRLEGAILLLSAIVYTGVLLVESRDESRRVRTEYRSEFGVPAERPRILQIGRAAFVLFAGIALVLLGSRWLVIGAVDLARLIGVSEAFIGLTIVAIGTSAPEIVTAIVATLRGDPDIAIGNLLGSNIYNVLAILGISCLATASGIEVEAELVRIDLPIMLAVSLISIPVFVSGRRVARGEGLAFVAGYCVYLSYLLLTRL